MACHLGVDVGTASVRAGLFSSTGNMLGSASEPIDVLTPQAEWHEQSAEQIWQAVLNTVSEAQSQAGVQADTIGFDATCSLVVEDADRNPIAWEEGTVLMWMDHRSVAEADEINRTGHQVLQHVGGQVSPEMQMPKLLWLKRNRPDAWARAARFFDLSDWLAYKATGSEARSQCAVTCKWNYLPHAGGWQGDFFQQIGFDKPVDALGAEVRELGAAQGSAVAEGLPSGAAVGVSAIDAHAGGIGSLGAASVAPEKALALIAGTSACHMALASKPVFVPGVWGPYLGAMVPGLWLLEGGQSAAGATLDQLRGGEPVPDVAVDAHDLHVVPDFFGNRSPLADPTRRGGIAGLGLERDVPKLFQAGIEGLAYGTRQIIEAMQEQGMAICEIVASGGLAKNRAFVQAHADATGMPVTLPACPEPVLLGAAILGAVAGGYQPDIPRAMKSMSRAGDTVEPNAGRSDYHQRKYEVYCRMQEDLKAYQEMTRGE